MIFNGKLKTSTVLELARNDLSAYAAAVYRRFEMPSHLRELISTLEKVERGEIDRVIITMPPRHGKSLLASTIYPAWFLGRNPEKSVIATSYSDALATDFGRRVRNFVSDRLHRQIFPDCELADSQSVSRFATTQGGNYFAVGAGGVLTGRGGDLILIDDPIKSAADAASPTIRRGLESWYESVLYPRLEPGGAIVIIQTRWSVGDLAGGLLSNHAGEGWVTVNFPALAERNDILGRREGEPLWPERFDRKSLARIKEAVGTSAWISLYQQRPVAEEGNIFKKDQLRVYGGPIDCTRTVFSLDTAFKTGQSNDYSAVVVVSEAKTGFHIRLVSRGRYEFPELKAKVMALAEIWRPSAILIEDAASGQSLIQSLKSETRLPILPMKALGDKVSRAHAVSPLVESGRVCIPESGAWISDFVEELVSFPAAPHDDQVDALTQALTYLRGSAWATSEEWAALGASMRSHEARKRQSSHSYSGSMTLTADEMTRREDGIARTVGGFSYTNRTTMSRIRGRGAW